LKNVSRGLLALAAAVSIGALPSAAHAERVVHNDAHGDVIYQTFDPETGESTEEVNPAVTAGDILRTAVRHRTSKVFVAISFADLRRDDATGGHFLRLVTNENLKRNVFLEVTKANPRGRLSFSKANGAPIACKGLSRDIDYSAETLRFEFPRSCLSNPRWVRVGFGTFRYPDSDSYNGFVDDANLDSKYGTQAPALGERVRRN
jgi:hypothetical protein